MIGEGSVLPHYVLGRFSRCFTLEMTEHPQRKAQAQTDQTKLGDFVVHDGLWIHEEDVSAFPPLQINKQRRHHKKLQKEQPFPHRIESPSYQLANDSKP